MLSVYSYSLNVPSYASLIFMLYRERSLRQVAMVTKFLDDNKPKTSIKKWLRTVSNFIDLIQFHLICPMLYPKGLYLTLESVVFNYFI